MTDKSEIIKKVKEYFKDNSIIDLTSFIQENCPDTHRHSAFVRDIAYKMKLTGKYAVQELESGQRFLVTPIPRKTFKERYWLPISLGAYFVALFNPEIRQALVWLISPKENKTRQLKKDIPPDSDHKKVSLYRLSDG